MVMEMSETKKKIGRPIPLWMRKMIDSSLKGKNSIVDYESTAREFHTTVPALRAISRKVNYPSFHIPNPLGGTIKKFKRSDFLQAVKDYAIKVYW